MMHCDAHARRRAASVATRCRKNSCSRTCRRREPRSRKSQAGARLRISSPTFSRGSVSGNDDEDREAARIAATTVTDTFDVIVIGAGHAGCEAAFAAARLGARVGVCTLTMDTVAHMPCNPAIGGTAKGHLVREIDALGGLMARAIDATGIQFKLLNRSRGPAVWSPRAQADKSVYGQWVKRELAAQPNIEWLIGRAGRILISSRTIVGLEMEDGGSYG